MYRYGTETQTQSQHVYPLKVLYCFGTWVFSFLYLTCFVFVYSVCVCYFRGPYEALAFLCATLVGRTPIPRTPAPTPMIIRYYNS